MSEIIDIGEFRAKNYKQNREKQKELKMLINTLDIAHRTILGSKHPTTRLLSVTLDKYKTRYQKELKYVEQALNGN